MLDGDRRRRPKRARAGARTEAVPGGGPQATKRALERLGESRAIVLVEGLSDQIALETLAARRGRNLDAEGISVVPIGGAQAIERFLARFGPEDWTRDWPVSVTRARRTCSGAVSSGPASAPTSLASIWNGWDSTFVSQTWRTS